MNQLIVGGAAVAAVVAAGSAKAAKAGGSPAVGQNARPADSTALPTFAVLASECREAWERAGNPLSLASVAHGAALLLGIADRESRHGAALEGKRLDGTGDKIKRTRDLAATRMGEFTILKATTLPNGLFKCEIMPRDGLGWGRGLMQIDAEFHAAWLREHARDWWTLPVQLDKACEVLRDAYRRNFDAVSPTHRARVAIAAYNAGAAGALSGYRSGDPDTRTTGKDYSRDVQRRADGFLSEVMGFA